MILLVWLDNLGCLTNTCGCICIYICVCLYLKVYVAAVAPLCCFPESNTKTISCVLAHLSGICERLSGVNIFKLLKDKLLHLPILLCKISFSTKCQLTQLIYNIYRCEECLTHFYCFFLNDGETKF